MVGGALKLVDPSGTVGALRALGLPASTDRVRVLAGAEVILGMLAWSVSRRVLAALVALSYAAFFVVTVLALVRKLPIDSCGCLGKLETPPSWRHLVVLGLGFLGALGSPSTVVRRCSSASTTARPASRWPSSWSSACSSRSA